MNGRRLLSLSLGLNLALFAGLFYLWKTRTPVAPAALAEATAPVKVRDRIVPIIRRQFFSWSELESTNYDTYVANLRDIACPEQTIHDIILADVNKLYEERKTVEEQSAAHFKSLDEERAALLTRLLGPDWDASEKKAGFAFSKVGFTDPLLDELNQETRDKVLAILSRWSQQAVMGKREAAELEQRMRLELAGVLSPAQLEELLSRYSANAINLNDQLAELQFFKTTPTEFHNLFRATDALDLQIRLLGDATDVNSLGQLKALQQQREQAIKIALGAKRYAEYLQLQDPAYREALAAAQSSEAPAQTTQAIYGIQQETAIEKAIVQADPSLTDTQKLVELKKVELEQLKAQVQAQGQELPPETPPLPPAATVNHTFTLSSGDNLNTLAQRFQLTPRQIQAANPGINFNAIKPGETIYLPMTEPAQLPAPGQ